MGQLADGKRAVEESVGWGKETPAEQVGGGRRPREGIEQIG